MLVQFILISRNSTTNNKHANNHPMYDYYHTAMKNASTNTHFGNWYTHSNARRTRQQYHMYAQAR